jgi:hypothetical protein
MTHEIIVQILALTALVLLISAGVRFVVYLRKKRTNTELWATVFEGLTHKTMNLEPLKEPKVFIEKRVKKDGQNKDADVGKAT